MKEQAFKLRVCLPTLYRLVSATVVLSNTVQASILIFQNYNSLQKHFEKYLGDIWNKYTSQLQSEFEEPRSVNDHIPAPLV